MLGNFPRTRRTTAHSEGAGKPGFLVVGADGEPVVQSGGRWQRAPQQLPEQSRLRVPRERQVGTTGRETEATARRTAPLREERTPTESPSSAVALLPKCRTTGSSVPKPALIIPAS